MSIIGMAENTTKNKEVRIICQNCQRETNHVVMNSIEVKGYEKAVDIHWEEIYQIVKCLGCDTLSFRIEKSDSESWDPEYPFTEVVYPKRSEEVLSNKTFFNLPYNINRVYKETIDCYNNDILTLCAAGIRALVEGICLENKIKDGPVEIIDTAGAKQVRKETLEGKINGLHEKGILTKENASVLHDHRLLGNEVLHRMTYPTKKTLSLAINIIENILDSIYEIPFKSIRLKQSRGNNI